MSDSTRTAIVTGAAQGVGEAVARRLAKEGVGRLVLVDRQEEKLKAVADELTSESTDTSALVLDLTDITATRAGIDAAVQALGSVDVLVNAAATTARGGITDTSPELFDTIFALNVRAPFFIMQAVAPAMPSWLISARCWLMVALHFCWPIHRARQRSRR